MAAPTPNLALTPAVFQQMMAHIVAMDGILFGAGEALKAAAAAYEADILASGQRSLVHALLPAKSDLMEVGGDSLAKSYLYRVMLGYTGPIRDCLLPGVTDPLSFAAYYNTGAGGAYKCLLPAGFASLYNRLMGKSVPPSSIDAPTMLLAQRSVGLPFAAVSGIDPALCAGASRAAAVIDEGAAFTQSRAAAANLVTVSGDARDSAGDVQQGREFTAAITAGQSIIPLVPAEQGDLLLAVKSLTLPPNMTAGTISIENTN